MRTCSFHVVVTIAVLQLATHHIAAADVDPGKLRLARATLAGGKVVVGQILELTETRVRIRDLKTDRDEEYRRTDIKNLIEDATDQEVVSAISPARIVAWRISQALSHAPANGKVAAVDGASFYVNLGTANAIRVGDELNVYRGETEIKDPDSGKVIGRQRKRVGRIVVIEADGKLSKAKLSGDIEVEVIVGDQVEPVVKDKPIAVIPPVSDDGSVARSSLAIAEEISTRLTVHGLQVVERSQLSKVITELGLQQSALFDATKSQSLGKQLGASTVIVGKVVPTGKNAASVSFRSVDVTSGRVTFATTLKLTSFDATEVVDPSDVFRTNQPPSSTPHANEGPVPNAAVEFAGRVEPLKAMKNPRDYVVRGDWILANDVLSNTSNRAVIGLPVQVTGSYELSFELNRASGDEVIFVTLPIGKRNVYLDLSSDSGAYHGLSFIGGAHSSTNGTARRPGRLENGTWHKITIRVKVNGENGSIESFAGKDKLVSWAGEIADCGTDGNWTPASKTQVGFATANARIRIQKIEIKGSARIAR